VRIAIVSTMYGAAWGGSEVLWAQTAKRLASQGHQVFASVVKWGGPRPALDELRAAGVVVWERPQSLVPVWLKAVRRLGLPLHDRRWTRQPRAWLESVKADLVCVSNGDIMYGADWLAECQALGVRYVNLGHGNHEQYWPDDDLADYLRPLFAAAARCFFVSEGNLRLFEKQIAQRLPNAEIVRNPFQVRWDVRLDWPEAEPEGWRLACVGRLEPYQKGHDLIMEVLSRPEWRDRRLTVSVFGRGPCEKTLARLAAYYGVEDRVRFCGHVEDVEGIWKTHEALLMPSRFEGLPLVVVEAMLCGRPVIATDVAGHREMIDDGITGFIAEAPTAQLVADAMDRAWQRRHEWQAMGQEAARRIRERVPADPAGAFASRLLSLAGKS
jgi:glycosyltransferase involved in cell wall biosynthesis